MPQSRRIQREQWIDLRFLLWLLYIRFVLVHMPTVDQFGETFVQVEKKGRNGGNESGEKQCTKWRRRNEALWVLRAIAGGTQMKLAILSILSCTGHIPFGWRHKIRLNYKGNWIAFNWNLSFSVLFRFVYYRKCVSFISSICVLWCVRQFVRWWAWALGTNEQACNFWYFLVVVMSLDIVKCSD